MIKNDYKCVRDGKEETEVFKRLRKISKEDPLSLSAVLLTIAVLTTVLNITLIIAKVKGLW